MALPSFIVSGDMQRRSFFIVAMWFTDDFNILIECHGETHEALQGKLPNSPRSILEHRVV